MASIKKAVSKAKSKAKATVKKAVSKAKTSFAKKVVKAAPKKPAPKKPAPKPKPVVKKAVSKPAPKKSAPKPAPKKSIAKPAPKPSPKAPSKPAKQSSFVSKLTQGAKKIATSMNPIKTARAAETYNAPKQAPTSTNTFGDRIANAFQDKGNTGLVNTGSAKDAFGNLFRKAGITRDYGFSEMFGGEDDSIQNVQNPNRVQKVTVPAAKTINKASSRLNPVVGMYNTATKAADFANTAGGYVATGNAGSPSAANSFTQSFLQSKPAKTAFDFVSNWSKPKAPTAKASSSSTGTAPAYTPVTGVGTKSGGYTYTANGWVADGQAGATNMTPTAGATDASVDTTQQPMTGQDFYDQIKEENPELYGLLVGDDYAAASEGIAEQYMSGNASDQETVQKMSDANRRQIENQYNRLLANYDKLPEQYRAQADRLLAELKMQLDMTYKQGVEGKAAIENSYGEAIRRKLRSDKINKNQLRNLYSSLGTAESSAFMEDMGELQAESDRDIFLAEKEKAGKIYNIDDAIRTAEQKVADERIRIISERDAAINAVYEDINLTEEQKEIAIEQNNLQALQQLAELQEAKKAFLLQQAADLTEYKGNIAAAVLPGLIEQQLLSGETSAFNTGNDSAYGIASMANGQVKYSDGTIRDRAGAIVGRWK